jgi:hypothetical protein
VVVLIGASLRLVADEGTAGDETQLGVGQRGFGDDGWRS